MYVVLYIVYVRWPHRTPSLQEPQSGLLLKKDLEWGGKEEKNKTGEEEEEDQAEAGGQAIAKVDINSGHVDQGNSTTWYLPTLPTGTPSNQKRAESELPCTTQTQNWVLLQSQILAGTLYNTACMCALPYTGTKTGITTASSELPTLKSFVQSLWYCCTIVYLWVYGKCCNTPRATLKHANEHPNCNRKWMGCSHKLNAQRLAAETLWT